MVNKTIDDGRKIHAIYFPDESGWRVGDSSGVEKILPYHENGEMGPVLWFAIYRKGILTNRINSKYTQEVYYKDAPDETG